MTGLLGAGKSPRLANQLRRPAVSDPSELPREGRKAGFGPGAGLPFGVGTDSDCASDVVDESEVGATDTDDMTGEDADEVEVEVETEVEDEAYSGYEDDEKATNLSAIGVRKGSRAIGGDSDGAGEGGRSTEACVGV